MNITEALFSLQDLKYKAFHSKLMPTVDPDTIIGVRIPELRKLAKKLKNTQEAERFLKELPHKYYEENNLHAFLIEQIDDYAGCITALERFLPYVDNWATCDSMNPKVLKKNRDKLMTAINRWLDSDKTYTVRFGIKCLMCYYLDYYFDASYLQKTADAASEEYYINMMIAWYFATALAKQWNSAIPFLEQKRLPPWIHNKTIQKAVESYRITPDRKAFLKTLRV